MNFSSNHSRVTSSLYFLFVYFCIFLGAGCDGCVAGAGKSPQTTELPLSSSPPPRSAAFTLWNNEVFNHCHISWSMSDPLNKTKPILFFSSPLRWSNMNSVLIWPPVACKFEVLKMGIINRQLSSLTSPLLLQYEVSCKIFQHCQKLWRNLIDHIWEIQ